MNILAPLKGRSPVGVDERLFLIDTLDSCVIGSSKNFKTEKKNIKKKKKKKKKKNSILFGSS